MATFTVDTHPPFRYVVTVAGNGAGKFTFTVKTAMTSTSPTFGTGYGLKATCRIKGGGSTASNTVTLKSTSDSWSGNTEHTASCTVNASSFYSSVSSATFEVERTDSYGTAGILAESTVSGFSSDYTEYTLTLAKGTGITSVSGGGTYRKGSSVSARAVVTDGYDFLGWYSGSTKKSSANPYTFALNSNLTLTAKAAQTVFTYRITYDANGGSGAPAAEDITGNAASFSAALSAAVPVRRGYTFLGWSKNSSAAAAVYAPGGSITLSANVTLYAVWKRCDLRVFYGHGGAWKPLQAFFGAGGEWVGCAVGLGSGGAWKRNDQ